MGTSRYKSSGEMAYSEITVDEKFFGLWYFLLMTEMWASRNYPGRTLQAVNRIL